MILTADIGNTETVIGLFNDLTPVCTWRLATESRRTADEITLTLSGFLRGAEEQGHAAPERLVVASVVPVLNRSWSGAGERLGLPTVFLTGDSPLPIRLDVDRPAEVGADRIANTLAASTLFKTDTIVVDLGTATTFDCVSKDGVFLGGVIAPGPVSLDQLTRATAQLPKVELGAPDRVIGRNTLECLRSGGFYTVVDGIDGIVDRIVDEWQPTDAQIVATGGLAEVVAPHCRTVGRIEPALTITGPQIAGRPTAHFVVPQQRSFRSCARSGFTIRSTRYTIVQKNATFSARNTSGSTKENTTFVTANPTTPAVASTRNPLIISPLHKERTSIRTLWGITSVDRGGFHPTRVSTESAPSAGERGSAVGLSSRGCQTGVETGGWAGTGPAYTPG